MAEKITQKQMFTLIAEKCADDEQIVEFCQAKIAQLDKRKNAPRKTPEDVLQRRQAVKDYLAGVEKAAVKDIADALGFTSPQVTGAIRGLGDAVVAEEGEKKSAPKQYRLADAAATEVDQF